MLLSALQSTGQPPRQTVFQSEAERAWTRRRAQYERGREEVRAAAASPRVLHWGLGVRGSSQRADLGKGRPCSDHGSEAHFWPQRGLDSWGAQVECGKDGLSFSCRELGGLL